MLLDKYFVDAVADDGAGFIGYSAHVRGLGPWARLASMLRWGPSRESTVEQARSVRGTEPIFCGDDLEWQCPGLKLTGRWTANEKRLPIQTLWQTSSGQVRWHVLAPRASVRIQHGDEIFCGTGYVERLQLNVLPWKLPIQTLHWGRHHSPRHTVIWIAWEFSEPRTWLWHNGQLATPALVQNDRVSWPGFELEFGKRKLLRSGRLEQTAFRRWKAVTRWLPRRLRELDETKWCSSTHLKAQSGASEAGWAIHENVRFG